MGNIYGMASRSVTAKQSKLDQGFVLLEVLGADGMANGSIVLTPKGADALSRRLAISAAVARRENLAGELLIWPPMDLADGTYDTSAVQS